MAKYIVSVREVHVSHQEIEAKNPKDAIEGVREGDGEEVYLEYSHTLEPDFWTVELSEKVDLT